MPVKKPKSRSFKKSSPQPEFASPPTPPESAVRPPTPPITIPTVSPPETPSPLAVTHPPTLVSTPPPEAEPVVVPPATSVDSPASAGVKQLASLPTQASQPSSPPYPPAPPELENTPVKESSPARPATKLIWAVLVVVLVAGLTVAGFAAYSAFFKKAAPEPSPAQADTTSGDQVSPTASPTPGLSRSDLTIQVLNGSGTAGVAGTVKTYLEGLGYQDIDTGNADSYDYTDTEISLKETKSAYLDLLTTDLKSQYSLSSESGSVPADSPYDVVIVVGQAKP